MTMSDMSTDDALQRFATIWEHVECGISIIDAETREILAINPVAARMFGDDPDKIIGKKCHKFICPAEVHSCPIMDKGQVVDRSERKFVRANGDTIPIVKSVAKIQYNGRLALLESFTDISNLKEAEARLLVLSVAEQASRAKSDFLSRMSHEIRTPMNAIIGMVKIAEKTNDIDKLKYCLSMIDASSNHLLGLINDILDMSKIEAGKLDLDAISFDIEKMLIKISDLIIEHTEEKNIRLGIFLSPGMRLRYIGDEMRLSQILTNLLSNAVKFTPKGGSIKLYARELEKNDTHSRIRFTIADTGIGLTQEQISRLFNAFEQADTSISRRFGGTGLGLAIVKSLTEKMNGRISVESTPGQGSVFIVEVELSRQDDAEQAAVPDMAMPPEMKILVIEPDAETRKQFASLAAFPGWTIDEAGDGAHGKELIHAARESGKEYALIFANYTLPDMTAIDVAGTLKADARKRGFIIMTTFLQWSKIDELAREAGIVHFMSMPLLPSRVSRSISEALFGNETRGAEPPEHVDARPDFSRISLLLAEDIDINREIFLSLLEDTGVMIDVAENGREAVEKFRNSPDAYDIIVMDVQMPEMDGYEATRSIRALGTDKAGTIPIIAMTANVFTSDIEKCLACGMNDHLAKPIDCEAVIEKIRHYCRELIDTV